MSVEVLIEGGDSDGPTRKSFRAELGKHIRVNPEPIARHCLRSLAAVSEDVVAIAECVALADRLVTRHRASGWRRRLHLKVPVLELSAFSGDVLEALTDALVFLSGDEWHIDLVQRSPLHSGTGYLPLGPSAKYVVPYSLGLDSFAQSKLLQNAHGSESILEVRSGVLQAGNASAPLVSVSRRFFAGHPREATYRTRPFVYFSVAGVAAATIGATAVVIGENGQGALGPSFARFGNEWPFRSTHPGFIERLARYLSLVFRQEIRLQQPQIWRTKGEVLGELAEKGLLEGWERTSSCSARPLQRRGHRGCGVCGGCMLRRVAVNAARLSATETHAFDIAREQLETGSMTDEKVEMPRNEVEILVRAALSMELFAKVSQEMIAREARDIPGVSPDDASKRLGDLSRAHAKEWFGMIDSLPNTSWLKRNFSIQ